MMHATGALTSVRSPAAAALQCMAAGKHRGACGRLAACGRGLRDVRLGERRLTQLAEAAVPYVGPSSTTAVKKFLRLTFLAIYISRDFSSACASVGKL
jgi:hypothetical protein